MLILDYRTEIMMNTHFKRAAKQNKERDEQRTSWRDSVALNIKPEIDLNGFTGKYDTKFTAMLIYL